MSLEALSKAYQGENLAGSYFTAPLRTYNSWIQTQILAANDTCEWIAWKICYVVSAIFAYTILGLLAIVGIAINICLIPPENGYSLWAKWNSVPEATEKFCNHMRADLLLFYKGKIEGFTCSNSKDSSRYYTRSGSMAPKKTAFKASTIEQKIGVHIELNMNPDFFFNCRELSMWSF